MKDKHVAVEDVSDVGGGVSVDAQGRVIDAPDAFHFEGVGGLERGGEFPCEGVVAVSDSEVLGDDDEVGVGREQGLE